MSRIRRHDRVSTDGVGRQRQKVVEMISNSDVLRDKLSFVAGTHDQQRPFAGLYRANRSKSLRGRRSQKVLRWSSAVVHVGQWLRCSRLSATCSVCQLNCEAAFGLDFRGIRDAVGRALAIQIPPVVVEKGGAPKKTYIPIRSTCNVCCRFFSYRGGCRTVYHRGRRHRS